MKNLIAVFLIFIGTLAYAEGGPIVAKLKPTKIFNDGGSSFYMEFDQGAMPGCYNNRGGRLRSTNPLFKETYSTILTMVAMGGIKGRAVFEVTGNAGSWSRCEIVGFDLNP